MKNEEKTSQLKQYDKIINDLKRHHPGENIFHAFQQIQHPRHTVLNIFDIVSHVPQHGYGAAPVLAVLGGEQML